MNPPNSTSPTECRRWPRVEEERLMTCRSKSHQEETIYFTRNISGGGLMFESPEALFPDTRLELGFYAPMDCERQTMSHMRVGAQVRWVSEIPDVFGYEGINRYRIGVAFDEIDPQDRACLEEYVKKRLMMASTERLA